MKNKVCHLTSVHSENDVRIFGKECVTLQQNGFDVSFIVAGASDKEVKGVKIYGAKKITSRFKRILFSGRPILRKALEINADLYHFHDSELLSVGKKLRKKGKIVIYDSHEDLPRQILTKAWIPSCFRHWVSRIVEKIENCRAKKMSAIVAATPHIQHRFEKIVSIPVTAICNYPIINEITQSFSWNDKEKSACYVGGLFKERGVFEMVRSINQVTGRLKLAGAFSPESLQESVQMEEGWGKTDFMGYLNRQQINELFAQSMVGLLILHPMPSYKDSLPIKMFEYMAAGIPVVYSDFPLWREIMEEAGCGVPVDPFDTHKIAAEITHLFENPKLAQEMGTAGREAVVNKYNWDSQAKLLIELYQKLLTN